MQDRIDPRAGGREHRHRLGDAIKGGAPLHLRQIEQRGDERSSRRDRDPPNIVDDRETPDHRPVDAPNADARVEQPEDCGDQHAGEDRGRNHRDPPPQKGPFAQCDRAYLVGHRTDGGTRQHNWVARKRRARTAAGTRRMQCVRGRNVGHPLLPSLDGFGLRMRAS